MNSKRLISRILVVAAAATLLTGFTRCGHRGPPDAKRVQRHIDRHVDDFVDDIDANESQAAQIRTLGQRASAPLPGIIEGHTALKASLRAGWKSPAPDGEALHQQLDAQIQSVSGLLHGLLDAGLELHRILTPEQRAEITDRME